MDTSHKSNPRHIALIVSGREQAHFSTINQEASDEFFSSSLMQLLDTSLQLNVQYLTLYSSGRTSAETTRISFDLRILFELLLIGAEELKEKGVSVRFIDNLNLKDVTGKKTRQIIEGASRSKNCTLGNDLVLTVMSDFTGREDIANATRLLCESVEQGVIKPEDIDWEIMNIFLATSDLPDPDLIIFTNGQRRLDNLLLWQSAYSELAFTEKHWSELTPERFYRIIKEFTGRERRFGGLKK